VAAVIVKDDHDPALEAGAFLPSRVSLSMVNTAPAWIVYVSPAVRAAESYVCEVLIVVAIYSASVVAVIAWVRKLLT
jgi:hypothetical protein